MIEDRGDTFTVMMHLRRVDGRSVDYRLWVDASSQTVDVREVVPDRLPAWCPDLHVDTGGLFCLGYGDDAPPPVTDGESAEKWWGILFSYLTLQERARNLGHWPNDNAWAHGGAAKHQAAAERLSAGLSADLMAALRAGRLSARKNKSQFLRVIAGGKKIYSVRADGGDGKPRIVNVRRPCLCGSGKAMTICSDHAVRAARLAMALLNMKNAETLFWELNKDRDCCGRASTCPLLKKEGAAIAA
jgi:hypothetical protein